MRKTSVADVKRQSLRNALWPGSAAWIWDLNDREAVVGFSTIPRLLSLVLALIKHLVRGDASGDPSSAYVDLWCRDFGQGIIIVSDEEEFAHASGYSSSRAVRTWRAHLSRLRELGFILTMPDGNREFGNLLLLNPLRVCARLHAEGKTPEGWWPAFIRRASAIGTPIPEPLEISACPSDRVEKPVARR
jgi:hypothetical protein